MSKWQIWGFGKTEEFDFFFFSRNEFSGVLRLEAQNQVTGNQSRV